MNRLCIWKSSPSYVNHVPWFTEQLYHAEKEKKKRKEGRERQREMCNNGRKHPENILKIKEF